MARLYAKGALKPLGMNRLEADYSMELELYRLAGEILFWKFEAVKLRLADGAFYTPDFLVIHKDGFVEFHETKGFFREAAKVRFKTTAEMYPFRFFLVKRNGKNWTREEF